MNASLSNNKITTVIENKSEILLSDNQNRKKKYSLI